MRCSASYQITFISISHYDDLHTDQLCCRCVSDVQLLKIKGTQFV